MLDSLKYLKQIKTDFYNEDVLRYDSISYFNKIQEDLKLLEEITSNDLTLFNILKSIFQIKIWQDEIYDLFIGRNIFVYYLSFMDLSDNKKYIRKQISRDMYLRLEFIFAQRNKIEENLR